MQTLRRTVAVLTFPAIAYLGAACERTDTPTEARRPTGAFLLSNDPTTRWVNDDDPNGGGYAFPDPGTSCENPGYQKIQDAVNAAAAGDRINVCPGTYSEQVTIAQDNIQLRSVRRWDAVIKAPLIMVPYSVNNPKFVIVRIAGAHNVTILAFTITGPGPGYCGSLHYGVRVDNGGSANILGNHITDIRDQETAGQLSGCQNGMGVVVGHHPRDLDVPPGDPTSGSARIEGNLVEHYQKNGIVVGGNGSSAVITANRVFGFGASATIGQNGIEVIDGATAEVKHNFSSGHIYTGPMPVTATGGLLSEAGTVDFNHNTLVHNDVDVYGSGSSAPSSLTHNRTRGSTFDGIVVDATNDATVGENRSEQNGGAGIGLYEGASTNTIENNQVESNSTTFSSTDCVNLFPLSCFGGGILLDDASSNIVRGNHVRNNGTNPLADNTDGIRANAPSTGNTIQGNHLRGNIAHDCHDGSTGNTWIDNHGGTSFGTAVCSDPDPQDDFAVEAGWDPSYPWYSSYDGLTTDYDWPSLYSTIDAQIQDLLDLLPQIGVGGVRRPSP